MEWVVGPATGVIREATALVFLTPICHAARPLSSLSPGEPLTETDMASAVPLLFLLGKMERVHSLFLLLAGAAPTVEGTPRTAALESRLDCVCTHVHSSVCARP